MICAYSERISCKTAQTPIFGGAAGSGRGDVSCTESRAVLNFAGWRNEEIREAHRVRNRYQSDLQIDDDVVNRLRAANENVAIGGFVERFRSIDDLPRNQTALTAVTNTSPARPTDRDVAGLSKLQNALVGRGLPMSGDATARE